jgi:hypothetical protein
MVWGTIGSGYKSSSYGAVNLILSSHILELISGEVSIAFRHGFCTEAALNFSPDPLVFTDGSLSEVDLDAR